MVRATVLAFFLACSPHASATFFDLSGEITDCNAFACGLAGLGVGDMISGYFEVDDDASAPGSTFTETDLLSAQIIVGTLDSGVTTGPFGNANLSTDANGEIVSGSLELTTTVDTGIGLAEVDVVLDATTGTWTANTDFFGLGQVAAGVITITRRQADSDGDGINDLFDNCTQVANAGQRDTDGDGIGNFCDPDVTFPNDCIVNFLDLNVYKANFFQPGDLDTDNNGDGQTNFLDLSVISGLFFLAPGPSAGGCN